MLLPKDLRRLRNHTEMTKTDITGRKRRHKMDVRSVGEAMGLSFQRISQWENGDGAPDPLQMMQLLKLYAANGCDEAAEIIKLGGPTGNKRPSVVLTPKIADLMRSIKYMMTMIDMTNTNLKPEVAKAKIAVTRALENCISGLADDDKSTLEGWL